MRQQHHNHGACCDSCHRLKTECHNYECKREKIKPCSVPTIGDPLNCKRENIGKHYPSGTLVRTRVYGGRRLDKYKFLVVDHSDDADLPNGFSWIGLDSSDVQDIVESEVKKRMQLVEEKYQGLLELATQIQAQGGEF